MSTVEAPNFDYAFDLPEINELDLYLAPHNSAADLPPQEVLSELFASHTIVIPEAVGANNSEEKTLNRVAQGNQIAFDQVLEWAAASNNPEWKKTFYASLFGSGARVQLVDLHHRHPIHLATSELEAYLLGSVPIIRNFDTATETFHQLYQHRLALLKERDQYILDGLARKIERSRRKVGTPQKSTSVYMLYGDAHLSLADALLNKKAESSGSGLAINVDRSRAYDSEMHLIYADYLRGEALTKTRSTYYMMSLIMRTVELKKNPTAAMSDVDATVKDRLEGLSHDEMRQLRINALRSIQP